MAGKRYEKVDLFAGKLVGLTISIVSVAFAQNLSVGGAAGTNLGSNFGALPIASGLGYTNTRTLLAGGTAEWSISRPISIEADGLYRRLHAVAAPAAHFSVVTWEFPILARYQFSLRHLAPFLEGGPSFRSTGNLNDIHPSHYGFTAGVGIERQVGPLRMEPVVRYTRWAQDVQILRSEVRTKVDQLEFLVGFRAPSLSNTHPLGAHLSLGVVAGTNLTNDFASVTSSRFPPALANISYSSQLQKATFTSSAGPKSFAGGPQVALELQKHLSLEVGAIYRPLRSSVQVFLPGERKDLRLADHRSTWEFPVLAQYQWRIRRAKPFVEMGPSFRLLQGVYGAAPYGIAVGAGVEERVGRLKISPGLRFTHWAQHTPPESSDPRRSEIAILTGFSL